MYSGARSFKEGGRRDGRHEDSAGVGGPKAGIEELHEVAASVLKGRMHAARMTHWDRQRAMSLLACLIGSRTPECDRTLHRTS